MLAVALGAFAWWNRYDSARRSTEFWGAEAAQLIVDSEQAELLELGPETEGEAEETFLGQQVLSRQDANAVRGMVHLRYALTSDSNYLWEQEAAEPAVWAWAIRFAEEDREIVVLLDEKFSVAGKYVSTDAPVTTLSCVPMTETLEAYFASVPVPRESKRSD